jgi:hypothetical protein
VKTYSRSRRWLAGSEQAVHEASKNPPEAYRDIIRVWGVLNFYRPPGQTSWSKALVRHGADPGLALAGVLGVSSEDIRVRDRDQRDRMSTSRL